MDYTIIEVPDLNDSVSRVVLSGVPYFIRFTYNDTHMYWKFSLYNDAMETIVCGIKIVPSFPLNVFYSVYKLPDGVFGVITKLGRIERDSFIDGKAKFIFAPVIIET